jgi:hypothetical protein
VQVEKPIIKTHRGAHAMLHLNGSAVGAIKVQGHDTSWTYGQFEPLAAFGEFAPIFGRWSLLMHDDEHQPLTCAAAHELREAERAMDSVRARVHFPDDDAWHDVAQLNIDGSLIEWKEV